MSAEARQGRLRGTDRRRCSQGIRGDIAWMRLKDGLERLDRLPDGGYARWMRLRSSGQLLFWKACCGGGGRGDDGRWDDGRWDL